ncbi:MAG TPA: hypothetical protein PKG77_19555 [Phycisphaerae bacterium]|nr:hypothetical protein [Phycisphaerae bacterium]HQL75975.1 hypothetical protein [Phycisphaerae bacterium]
MNPRTTFVHIQAYPHGLVEPSLLLWLTDHGFSPGNIYIGGVGHRGIVSGFNEMIRVALSSPFDTFLFAERDIRPNTAGHNTEPFLNELGGDIVCATYPCGNSHAWDHTDAFHTGLWRTTRAAMLKIQPPWFTNDYADPMHIRPAGCECASFARKAIAAGLKIVRSGEADHTPSH